MASVEKRYRAMLAHAPCGVVLINPSGVVEYTNQEFSRMSGYQDNIVCGWPIERFLRQLFNMAPQERAENITAVLDGQSVITQHVELDTYQGLQVPVQLQLTPFEDEDGFMIFIHDRTIAHHASQQHSQHMTEMALLRELVTSVNYNWNLDAVLRIAASVLRLMTRMELVAIQLYDADRGSFEAVDAWTVDYPGLWQALGSIDDPESVLGRIVESHDLQIVDAFVPSTAPEVYQILEQGFYALICLPLAIGADLVGFVVMGSRRPQPVRIQTRLILPIVAREVGSAIRNASIYERAMRDREYAEKLAELMQATSKSFESRDIFQIITDQFRATIGVHRCILIVHNASANKLRVPAASGLGTERICGTSIPLNDPYIWQTMKDGQVKYLEPPENPLLYEGTTLGDVMPRKSALLVPLRRGEKVVGVVGLVDRIEGDFEEADIKMVEGFAASMATVLRNVELYEQVREARDQLDLRVQERTEELERTLQELVEANEFKTQVLSMVSHELRTPLSGIKGYITTLIDYASRLSPEKQKDLLEIVDSAADRLTHIISDLLDLTRFEAGRLYVSPDMIPYRRILVQVHEVIIGESPRREIKQIIEPGTAERVWAEAKRLHQILLNLVANANKYSPLNKPITIYVRQQETQVIFEVRDQGDGVEPAMRDKIFEPFHRAAQPNHWKKPGLGLGLPICRALVKAHGGQIGVADNPDGPGSSFWFSLSTTVIEGTQRKYNVETSLGN